jgi:acyl-homoserine lactone acylase PvdQ
MRRFQFDGWLWLAVLLACARPCSGGQVTLYRDRFGVPSVAASSLPDALYGLGYAMAQDSAVQMARNYKQARGRLAEVDGRSQLLADGFLRSLGLEQLAEEKAKSLVGEQADLLRAFCAGANGALAEQKGRLPDWVQPFTPTDVLALAQLINAAFPLEDVAHHMNPGAGSNQFAVGGTRTAGHHALLSMDPHLDWGGIFAWYEFSIYTPQFNFRGVTLNGLPFGSMGHTDRVAWCFTNNNPQLYAFYKVETSPDHPNQYNDGGVWRDFETMDIDLSYRDGDTLKSVHQKVRRTAWGPLLPFQSVAVRLSMLGAWGLLDEALNMARARNAGEVREALRPLGLSMWNVVYADTAGHIGYQYNARVPHLDPALDWNRPVPGSDPRAKWGEWWTLDALPHIENPLSELLINSNSAPWLTPTDQEIRADAWPAYVTSYGHTTRYDRLAELLTNANRVTPEQAKRIATDTLVPYAVAVVNALRDWANSLHAFNAASSPDVIEGLRVLGDWTGRADVEARGCALYTAWYQADPQMPELARKMGQTGKREAWSVEEAEAALTALQKGAATLRKQQGRLDVLWGAYHYAERGGVRAPLSGWGYMAAGDKAAAVVPNSGPIGAGPMRCTFGSSFRMIVDLDPKGVRSWSILPYGEAQDPGSAHYADQMPLFGRGEYKDTQFGLKHAQKDAVTVKTLNSP